eukprot:comp19544_c0_seq1/m.22908 comp19544_c0_seq1/g.22908  ORF comp19544_c0_seq1/g.22908 comp19544_c0_seq1/m.22908 type:complete len:181 (-) comp19544_c0_seq1:89-631(-)
MAADSVEEPQDVGSETQLGEAVAAPPAPVAEGPQRVTVGPSEHSAMLEEVARTGNLSAPWDQLRTALVQRLDQVVAQFCQQTGEVSEAVGVIQQQIATDLQSLPGAPFTLQRLCELLVDPGRHYANIGKYLRGVEKLVRVTSTVGGAETVALVAVAHENENENQNDNENENNDPQPMDTS